MGFTETGSLYHDIVCNMFLHFAMLEECNTNINMFGRNVVLLRRLLQIDQHLNGGFKRTCFKNVY